jgi:hypothetical protein
MAASDEKQQQQQQQQRDDDKTPAETESSSLSGSPDPPPAVEAASPSSRYDSSRLRRLLTPPNCRWDPSSPPPLTNSLCVLYALSATFTVANLYYCQPILNRIAATFDVSYEQSSQAATLIQAGYAVGIVFLLPLGDMLERRPFIISIIAFTATVVRLGPLFPLCASARP